MILKPEAARTAAVVAVIAALLSLIAWSVADGERSGWLAAAAVAPGLWLFFEIKGRILMRSWGPGTRIEVMRRAYGTIVSGMGAAVAVYAGYAAGAAAFGWELTLDTALPRYAIAVLGAFLFWWGNYTAKHVDWGPRWTWLAHADGRGEPEREAVIQSTRRSISWIITCAGAAAFVAAAAFPDAWLVSLTRFGGYPLMGLICARITYARLKLMWNE
ncbi:MAG: hypothetical protein PVI23_00585 [Maricaulaceae bacterium]|jgi:hypothetical protein